MHSLLWRLHGYLLYSLHSHSITQCIKAWLRISAQTKHQNREGKRIQTNWHGCWCQTNWFWVFQKLLTYMDSHTQPHLKLTDTKITYLDFTMSKTRSKEQVVLIWADTKATVTQITELSQRKAEENTKMSNIKQMEAETEATIGQLKNEEMGPCLKNIDFCCYTHRVGSAFGVNSMEAWIHTAMYHQRRLGILFWANFGSEIDTIYNLYVTAYLSISALVHSCMSNQSSDGYF